MSYTFTRLLNEIESRSPFINPARVEDLREGEEYIENFVPVVLAEKIRKRIDEYFAASKSGYTLENGEKVAAHSQFRISTDTKLRPDAAKIKIRKALKKTESGKNFLNGDENKKAIDKVVYGRPTPYEIFLVTQALIDSGEFTELRKTKTQKDYDDEDLIRMLQQNFGVGIDCAGYVQLAFLYAYTGSDSDPPKKRKSHGLKKERMNENLRSLPLTHFKKIDILKAETGDLFVLNPKKGDSSGHTVIIVDHLVTGDTHSFVVDASWGTSAYGSPVGGIARRTWEYDTAYELWADVDPRLNYYQKANENRAGPYKGHPIQGVFRPKLNPASQKEFDEAEEFYSGDSEFDNYIGDDENWQQESEINLSKAIDLNRRYRSSLGWNQYYDQINKLLLPYSGQQNISLGDEAFAQAVAAWQQQQGLTSDGAIGPNTWAKMKPMLTMISNPQPVINAPVTTTSPSNQHVFSFNQWHAQKILDSINTGIVSVNTHLKFNPKSQLEKIVRGEQVLNVNSNTEIIQVLPVIYHICEQARLNNYFDIMIGSFIREASGGKCAGHCKGRCIDINFKGGSFATMGSVQMVINIFTYLNSLSSQYRKAFGFGLPLQGDFFGNKNLTKFKSTNPSNLINAQLKLLISPLGIVFPDNDNHLHIQVKWM